MNHIVVFACSLFSVLVLWATTPQARGELTFVPIDNSDKRYEAKDFGYQVEMIVTGARSYVTIRLDEEAAKSFTGARLALYQGGNLLVESRPGLERDKSGEGHVLFFAFDPRVITGGELIIHSKPIKDRMVVKNFGGFALSVQSLLEKAIPPEKLEEIRKAVPAPNKKDPTPKLLEDLEQKDPFVRAAAIDLLGGRKAKEAIPKLIELLADGTALIGSDNYVGSHAATALSMITGRPFSVDQKDWTKWWEEHKKESGQELLQEVKTLRARLEQLERRLSELEKNS